MAKNEVEVPSKVVEELRLEQQSHDRGLMRICQALAMPYATVEGIVQKIQEMREKLRNYGEET